MSETLVGECESFEEFEEAVTKFYINRKIKSRGKDVENEADRIPCDIIIAIRDRLLVVWPFISGNRFRPIRFFVKKEDWKDVLKRLTRFLEENGMRKPIKFASVKKEKYLIGFCKSYKNFEEAIEILHIKRPGKEGDIRCDIIAERNTMIVSAVPNKETANLIELRFDVQDPDKWEEVFQKAKAFSEKEGIAWQTFGRVAKW